LGLIADWSRVFGLAAQLDKAAEIDCYPDRQDLSIDLLAIARKEGAVYRLGPIRTVLRVGIYGPWDCGDHSCQD